MALLFPREEDKDFAATTDAATRSLSAISLGEMIGPMAFTPPHPVFTEPAARDAGILMDEPPR